MSRSNDSDGLCARVSIEMWPKPVLIGIVMPDQMAKSPASAGKARAQPDNAFLGLSAVPPRSIGRGQQCVEVRARLTSSLLLPPLVI